MESVFNHYEICQYLYNGNTEMALETFLEKSSRLDFSGMFLWKTYLISLNMGIYNYILLKENISLHECCMENEEKIRQSIKEEVIQTGKEIILSYGFDTNYLIEKYNNEHIKKTILYIHEHLSEPLTLEQVSIAICINKTYLCDLFHKETGVNFCAYVTMQRLKLAKKLLTRTNDPIHAIALKCGFRNTAYFSSCFKKHTGQSPSELRHSTMQSSAF